MNTILTTMTDIARKAGKAILLTRAEGLQTHTKGHGELVTSADFASHRVLMGGFRSQFPELPVVSEEGDHSQLPQGPFLVADELDGTNPFAAGSEHWAVMIAVIDQEPTHGVIFLPDLKILITAEQGRGCHVNGRPVTVRSADTTTSTLLGTEINPHLQDQDWRRLIDVTPKFRAVRSTACAAASTYELLAGITHAYLNLRGGRIWDFAAPALAIREAGGIVADRDGQPLQWNAISMSFLAVSQKSFLAPLLSPSFENQM